MFLYTFFQIRREGCYYVIPVCFGNRGICKLSDFGYYICCLGQWGFSFEPLQKKGSIDYNWSLHHDVNSRLYYGARGLPVGILQVDDLASAIYLFLNKKAVYRLYNVRIWFGYFYKKMAQLVQEIVGHKGKIQWDISKPDGTPGKLLNTCRVNSEGWEYQIELRKGIYKSYKWYLDQ